MWICELSRLEEQERADINETSAGGGRWASNVDKAKISSEMRCKECLAQKFIMASIVLFG